jgi:hypothetical protein
VLGYLPKSKRDEVLPHLRSIFYQSDRQAADQQLCAFCARYETSYPTAIECLRRDSDACLTFYAFPEAHWKTIRTTNVIEIVLMQIAKRRLLALGASRDDIANLHLAVVDDNAIDEQFYQLPLLVKRELFQRWLDTLTKRFNALRQSGDVELLLDLNFQLAQLLGQAVLGLGQLVPFALELITANDLGEIYFE